MMITSHLLPTLSTRLADSFSSFSLVVALFIILITFGWTVLFRILHRYALKRTTVLLDLPYVGVSRSPGTRIKGAVVICGGSIAGLLAARICADHFEEVIIVEPEEWLATEEGKSAIYDKDGVYINSRRTRARTRCEQYNAVHVFQPLAFQALCRLFPDFKKKVRDTDGRISNAEFNIYAYGGRIMRLPKDDYPDGKVPQCFFMSRESYERMLRGLVVDSQDRIKWVVGKATGLKMTQGEKVKVDYVTIRLPTGEERNLKSSLVIDCTGRSQNGLKWLKRLYDAGEISSRCSSNPFTDIRLDYNTQQRYQSFRFFVPPEARARLPIPGGYEKGGPWLYTFMSKAGADQKCFVVNRLEGHRIEIVFGGWGNPQLPEAFIEIKDFLVALAVDEPIPTWLIEMVDVLIEFRDQATNERLKYPDLSWIRYETVSPGCMPSNFVAIGDSIMIVNPAFGQGCTKACIGSITLDSLLRAPRLMNSTTLPDTFSTQFFNVHSAKISSAWNGTKPADYQWETTRPVKGEKLSDEHFTGGFLRVVMQLAKEDKHIDSVLWHIRCLLAPPSSLLQPSILIKCALFKLKSIIMQ